MEEQLELKEKDETLSPSFLNVTTSNALQDLWGVNNALIVKEINKVTNTRMTSHGLFASVPIVCKGQSCKFKDTCTVDPVARITGQRCVMEISTILARYQQWCSHFGIDITQAQVHDEDITDASLVKDLVVIEVQMMRVENKIAMDGDFMAKVLVDIDRKCNPYYEDDISKPSSYLLELQKQKAKILNQLNATRKDKATDKSKAVTPTENAIKIFQQVQETLKKQNIIDIDAINFDDVEEPSVVKKDEVMETIII